MLQPVLERAMPAQVQDSNVPADQGHKGRNLLKMPPSISLEKNSTNRLAVFIRNLALLSGGIIR
jgi:hypothetical protein